MTPKALDDTERYVRAALDEYDVPRPYVLRTLVAVAKAIAGVETDGGVPVVRVVRCPYGVRVMVLGWYRGV